MPLVSELDPAATTAPSPDEAEAWNAYQQLRQGPPAGAPPELAQQVTTRSREILSGYREKLGDSAPLFPTLGQRSTRQREEKLRDLFTRPFDETLDPERYAALRQRADTTPAPEAYMQRQALKTYLRAQWGKPIPAANYPLARKALARHLGTEDSDSAVFSAIRTRYQDHENTRKLIESFGTEIAHAEMSGMTDAAATVSADILEKIPEHLRDAATSEFREARRQARETRRKAAPHARQIARLMGQLVMRTEEADAAADAAGGAQDDPTMRPGNLEQAVDQLMKLPPDLRGPVIAQARAILENAETDAGLLRRIDEEASNIIARTARDTIQFGRAAYEQGIRPRLWNGIPGEAAAIARDQAAKQADTDDERFQLRAALLGEAYSLPSYKASDGLFERAILGTTQAATSTGLFLAGTPGLLFMGTGMMGQSYQSQRLETPEGNRGDQLVGAAVSGGAQLGVEFAMTRAGLRLLRGKAPTIAGILSKSGIQNKYLRGALGGAMVTGAAAGTEYSEEVIQAGIDRLTSDLVRELGGLDATTNWGQFLADWNPVGGSRQAQETLFAVVPFALLGAGAVGSYSHFKYGHWLQQSRPMLRAVGIPEAKIDAIQQAEPEQAAALTRQAFEEGLEQRTASEKAAALEVFRESAQLYAQAGLPIVFEDTADNGDPVWVFDPDPAGGRATRQLFETETEAFSAWHDAMLAVEQDALDSVVLAGRDAALDQILGEGTALEGKGRAVPIDRAAPRVTEASQVTDAFGKPLATPEQIAARVQQFLLQGGQQKDVPNLVVKARRHAERLRDGSLRQTIQYFTDTDPLAILEDGAESFLSQSIADGFLEPAQVAQWIRATETATGATYLAADYDPAAGFTGSLAEAFSAIVRDYAIAQVRSDLMPTAFRDWVSMSAVTMGSSFAYAEELRRSPQLAKAIAEGRIDSAFEAQLADALGLNPAEIDRRLEQRYREQVAAEAMEGMPEVADAAKGQLPHPQTLRDKGHPLAGEAQRVFDALKRPTRARKKDGRPVMRTNEANAYFLPYGEMVDLDDVRVRLNEQGFSFDTPAELLTALDESLNYEVRTHATRSIVDDPAGPTYSMGINPQRPGGAGNTDDAASPSNVVTPEMDAEYLAAADSGDLSRAQRVFDRAAEAMGFVVKTFFHGSPSFEGNKFQIPETYKGWANYTHNFWFTDDIDLALYYADETDIDDVETDIAKASGNPAVISVYLKNPELTLDRRDYEEPGMEEESPVMDANGMLDRRKHSIIRVTNIDDRVDSETIGDATIIGTNTTEAFVLSQPIIRDENGNVIPLSQRFDQSPPAASGDTSFSIGVPDPQSLPRDPASPLADPSSLALSPASINRLEAAIAAKMTEGPVERADYYTRLRDRLAGVLIRYKEFALAPGATDAERQLRAAREALEETKAILGALPPEARGRVNLPIADILDAKTQRGRVTRMIRLIDDADAALETVLKDQYREAIGKLMDLAKPDVNPATRQARGRLTPETQREVGQILAAVQMTPVEAGIAQHNADLELARKEAALAAQEPGTEDFQRAQAAYIEARVHHYRVNTFGAVLFGSAADLAAAHDALFALYKQGRYARNILEDARRQEMLAMRQEVRDSLKPVDQPTHSRKTAPETARARLAELARSWRTGHYSFHDVLETLFPKSTTVAKFLERARAADTGYKRALIDHREHWEQWARTHLELPQKGWKLRLDHILAKLSKREDTGIEIREGTRFVEESLDEGQAVAILEGRMKPGWETDPMAMLSLRQALADFRILRDRDKKRVQKVRFQRLKSRGAPAFLHMSHMEMAYILQLAAQKEYTATLDAWGFTPKVLDQILQKADTRALRISDYLSERYDAEYERLNPVFRELYGFDMPKIRNYAPGRFEHAQNAPDLDPEAGDPMAVNALTSGFTKNRVNHLARPKQKNALGLYWEHVAGTEYFIHWASLIREMRATFLSPEIRRSIEGNFGMKAAADFYRWIDVLAADGNIRQVEARAQAEMASKLQLGLAAVGLAYNLGSVAKQAQAALNGFLEMPVKDVFAGARRVIEDPSIFAKVWRSETIQQRVKEGLNPEDRRLVAAANQNPSLILEAYRLGRYPLAAGDAIATSLYASAAYAAHYDRALKAGMTPEAAEAHAMRVMDRIVKKTAQPATTQDRSLNELTAGRMGMIVGYMFRSDPRQKLAIVLRAFEDFKAGRIDRKTLARKLIFGWVVYGLMNELLSDMWQAATRDDDDPERWHWRDYVAAMVAGPLSGGGWQGGMLEAGIRGSIGTDYFGGKTQAAQVGDLMQKYNGSRFVSTLLDDADADLGDLIQDMLGDARDYATLLTPISEKFAMPAVGARILRDAVGIVDRWTVTETERQDRILAEYKATQQAEREAARAERGPQPVLSPQERALRSLKIEHRAEAIQRIVAPMSEAQRRDFLARLTDLGILTPATREAMQ